MAAHLINACFCVTLDRPSLEALMRKEIGDDAVRALIGERRHLFAEAHH